MTEITAPRHRVARAEHLTTSPQPCSTRSEHTPALHINSNAACLQIVSLACCCKAPNDAPRPSPSAAQVQSGPCARTFPAPAEVCRISVPVSQLHGPLVARLRAGARQRVEPNSCCSFNPYCTAYCQYWIQPVLMLAEHPRTFQPV
jgi:hypothetical protein